MKQPPHFAPRYLSQALLLCALSTVAYANDDNNGTAQSAEFDARLLMPSASGQQVDISRYRYGNPISAGDYPSDIYVNGERRGQLVLTFMDTPNDPILGLCVSPTLITLLDVKSEAVTLPTSDQCPNITQVVPSAGAKFDVGALRLDVTIPQILLTKRPKGYIAPSQWQAGVNAGFLRYQFNHHQYDYKNGSDTHHRFLGLQTGANLGSWSLRHSGAYSWQNQGGGRYQSHETYAQKDLDTVKGRVVLGDFFTRSNVLDNFAVRGISIMSDTRMLPDAQSGYAPVVRGIANSNAKVSIRHNDRLIYETTVPAGVFVIDDINPSGYSGDLQVEVTEDTGERRQFVVPIAESVRMLRPKQLRYEATLGYFREDDSSHGNAIAQTSVEYGVNNQLTAHAGMAITDDYQALALGAVWGTPFGTLESTLHHAKLTLADNDYHANTLRLNYNKHFNQTGSHLYASWQRHLSGDNFNLRHAVMDISPSQHSQKNRYQLSFSQSLGDRLGSFYVSGSSSDKSDADGYLHEYQIGYGNSYKNLQYRIAFSQTHDSQTNERRDQLYVNLSLPFGGDRYGSHRHWLSASHTDRESDNQSQLSLSGSAGKDRQFNYGISTAHYENGTNSHALYGNYQLPLVALNGSASRSRDSTQISYGVSGAVVAHAHGITPTRELGETFAIVHAKGAKGATISSATNLKLDRLGNGIVPNLTPYRINHVSINPSHVADDIEVMSTGKDIIPRANSIGMVSFNTVVGSPILFEVSLADGSPPPIAAEARDEAGTVLGYVVQGGQLFVRGIPTQGSFAIVWGTDKAQQCQLHYTLPNNKATADTIQTIPAQCTSQTNTQGGL